MKKLRGKRRYFRNLWKEVSLENSKLNFNNESWFDLWHNHLDFSGYGNRSLRMRRQHIEAHIALYRNVLKKLETFEKQYQAWIHIDDNDASRDAVFIHTTNPNEDNFPLKVEKLNWNCTIPIVFQDFINPQEFIVGHNKSQSEGGYIIQSIKQGNRLKPY